MKKWTHIATGLCAGVFLFKSPAPNSDLSVLATAVGSWLPDIDAQLEGGTENSSLKHRGITHTVTFTGIVYLIGLIVNYFFEQKVGFNIAQTIFLPLSAGILVHIFFDSWTVGGIQPFLPFSSFHFWFFAMPSRAKAHYNASGEVQYKTNRGFRYDNSLINIVLLLGSLYLAYIMDMNNYVLYNINTWFPSFKEAVAQTINGFFASIFGIK